MKPEDHQQRHQELHRMLDELVACYLTEGFAREDAGGKRASIHDEIFSLMKWSHEKSIVPSPTEPEHYRAIARELIAQSDDPELLEWLSNASQRGGGFVHSIAEAGLRADPENYALLRFVLMALRAKYPDYEPSDAVKQEIQEKRQA